MHPLISFDLIKKKLPEFNFLPENILISKNSLEEDLVSAKALLYRGSTVAITAGANGVTPIYIKQKNEMSIDPIYNAESGKFEISDPNEFKKVFVSKAKQMLKEGIFFLLKDNAVISTVLVIQMPLYASLVFHVNCHCHQI